MTERASADISGVAQYQLHRRANYGHTSKSTLNINNNYFFLFVSKLTTQSETAEKNRRRKAVPLIY